MIAGQAKIPHLLPSPLNVPYVKSAKNFPLISVISELSMNTSGQSYKTMSMIILI